LSDSAFERKFLDKVRAMAKISHPSLVSIHDFGIDEALRVAYLVMEYVEGESLAKVLDRDTRLSAAHTMLVVAEAAHGLHAAHAHHLVHGGVSPSNMLLQREGPLILTSVGSAQIVTAQPDELSMSAYSAPELSVPGGRATPLSDVYALGAVAFRCLNGRGIGPA